MLVLFFMSRKLTGQPPDNPASQAISTIRCWVTPSSSGHFLGLLRVQVSVSGRADIMAIGDTTSTARPRPCHPPATGAAWGIQTSPVGSH
jgi:hypothetical protein